MNKFLSRSGKALAVASSLVILADLAKPIAPFAIYLAAICIIAFVCLLIYKIFSQAKKESIAVAMYFFAITGLLSSTLFIFQSDTQESEQNGLIASLIPAVKKAQISLGMIEKNTQEIAKNTSETAKNTKEISSKMDSVKQETSDNPRKELANMGILFKSKEMVAACKRGDMLVFRLFTKANMTLSGGRARCIMSSKLKY